MTGAGRRGTQIARVAGLLAGLAAPLLLPAALPVPSGAQTIFGDDDRAMPSGRMTGAPLATSSGQAALAPSAAGLGEDLRGDRTQGGATLEVVEPDADVTLPDRPAPGEATDAATVLADTMVLQDDRTLIAAGGVVIWYQGARLVASRLIVDGASGDLTIEGPIHLSRPGAADPDAEAVLVADSAQLDRKLQDGIIRGARLVIARELQLAATDLTRSDEGRITRLRNVVASSCQVCAANPTPLWEIRARSITHDAETRLLTFESPQLRAFGVPIAAVPLTVTAPDPTVERKSGFLKPEIRTTSGLGFGVKLPYFQTMGDHADLTITPYVSASRTRTLELRYRQAWRRAVTEWNGAVSRDDIQPGETRGYVFGNALVDLPRGYRLGVQVQAATDRGYLLDYDITDADRLWSGLTLERITRERLFYGRVGNYHSLRDDEDNRTSPAQVADVLWQRRFSPRLIGGEGVMEWSIHAHRRPSDADIDGRDIARGSVGLDWRRTEILPGGLVGAAIAGLDADLYRIAQDDRFDPVEGRVDPLVGVELRWPLAGSGQAGATHLVEPVAQLLWSPRGEDQNIPNEDSRLIEFDEGNLFSDNRFPGWDARETGLRANLGVGWTRIDPTGWSLGLTGGRVLRARDDDVFAADSPLGGRRSDWLLATHYDSGTGLAVANRALFDDSFTFSRNELRVGWLRPDLQLSAGHLWINSDENESRDSDISELTAHVGWQIADGWWGNARTRYDFVADRAQRASLDLTYRNECLTLDMGLSRRFTDSRSVRPETSFDLSVRLGGFGSSSDGPGTVARRSCMR
ncbi:LPS-assembly protein LptD [Paracoccus stylophorae]|uniref:LPS-assembly protein LptD n=1 Tax=Paracoccus stylophorae TaxID=659350 RepID=A0ABY7ST19_9RHOB|nr:LPS assembly protein LptD [Paracoccus stylophorae]WCR10160.1 LPS-assembly protein LptD [Paracoccus stylophorae]